MFLAPVDLDGSKSPTSIFDELLEQAERAEEWGYDYVWIPEHVLVRYITSTDILQLALLIAERTKRIRIGGAVFVTPFYHPLGLVGRIAQADHLMRGRFEPGFGRGGSAYERRQFEVMRDDADSRAYFEEFMTIVRRSWESPEAIAFDGRFFTFDNSLVIPLPYSTPHPRIWLAATSAGSAGWAASQGLDVLFTAFRQPIENIGIAHAAFLEGGGGGPGPHGPTRFAVNRTTYVAPTMEAAREILPIIRHHDYVSTASRTDAERVVNGFREWDATVKPTNTYEDYLERLAIGDPETVREQMARYQEIGIDQFIMWTAQGQEQSLVLRSAELFASEVMPYFRTDVALSESR